MRLSEMFTLKTEDIDLKNRTIFLHRSKTGHRRQVPISSVLLAKLEACGLEGEWLFPEWWQGGDLKQRTLVGHRLTHRFARVFEKAECPDFRFHDLRHTAVCRFYERTQMSDMEISKITGHRGFGCYSGMRTCEVLTLLQNYGDNLTPRPATIRKPITGWLAWQYGLDLRRRDSLSGEEVVVQSKPSLYLPGLKL